MTDSTRPSRIGTRRRRISPACWRSAGCRPYRRRL